MTTMKLGYFAMPVHPLHRDYTQVLREDREAVILCDELGFHDAFIGEHLTDKAEGITNSMMFHATLIHSTKQIKLATGTTNLSHMPPILVAANAAMFDHLAEGRFILGISPGALRSDAEALGMIDEDRNQIFAEAIDVILEIWARDPPYSIDLPDNRFKVSTEVSIFEMVFAHDRDEPEEAITLDRILDDLVICGTVNDVVDKIIALREVTGDFGELVYAGTDWVDEKLSRRSMQLMAEEVMPRVNAAIGKSTAAE